MNIVEAIQHLDSVLESRNKHLECLSNSLKVVKTKDILLGGKERAIKDIEAIKTVLKELETKDKIILKMAEYIEKGEVGETFCKTCERNEEECACDECIRSIIKYFEE